MQYGFVKIAKYSVDWKTEDPKDSGMNVGVQDYVALHLCNTGLRRTNNVRTYGPGISGWYAAERPDRTVILGTRMVGCATKLVSFCSIFWKNYG